MRPAERFIESPLRHPNASPYGRNRTYRGREVRGIPSVGLLEQVERTVQITLHLPDASHRHPPAIRVLRQASMLAQLLAPPQVLRGGCEIVPFTGQLAQADVHIGPTSQG